MAKKTQSRRSFIIERLEAGTYTKSQIINLTHKRFSRKYRLASNKAAVNGTIWDVSRKRPLIKEGGLLRLV